MIWVTIQQSPAILEVLFECRRMMLKQRADDVGDDEIAENLCCFAVDSLWEGEDLTSCGPTWILKRRLTKALILISDAVGKAVAHA